MGKIRITQIRSTAGREPRQRRVMEALGLHRINQTVEHDNSPVIRGMVKKVLHLVRFEETQQ